MNSIPDILLNAQKAYAAQNINEAEKNLLEVLKVEPSNITANYITGLIAFSQGKNVKALKFLEKAASLCDDDPQIFYNYGTILQRTAKYQKAAMYYEKALTLKPDYVPALNNYSALMNSMGNVKNAENAARKIIEINPSHADSYNNLGNCLKDQGRIKEAIDSYKNALLIQPDNAFARSNMLLCLNYSDMDAETLFNEHKKWEESVRLKIISLKHRDYKIDPQKSPLRLGYVSAFFKTHSIAYFIEAILENHDRTQFEVFCYADMLISDQATIRIKKLPIKWRSIHEKNDNHVAELIMKDKIDILVDLAGHAGNKRLSLFLNRIVPIQITYIGYPNTTGLSTIDYRLTDRLADPHNLDSFYTEKLYRLPGCFLCYKPLYSTPAVAELPALRNGYITFGSFNNLPKISLGTIDTWCKILKAVSHSKLVIKTKPFNDSEVIKRYEDLFVNRGIERNRLIFKGYSPSLDRHLNTYNEIDIGLDTFPYNGTTTTCEALWMGVPVITLAGEKHAGRVGVSLMMCIGLSGMIADNTDKYVALASFLANDVQQLSKLRKSLRAAIAHSPLCDSKTFTRKLENAYRDMWQRKTEAES